MKIHILTSVFYPELHPRAFRAFELAKEFAHQGDEVHISVLTRVEDFDYKHLEEEYNINIHLMDFYLRKEGEDSNQTTKKGFSSVNQSVL